jgi:hypothetical protein
MTKKTRNWFLAICIVALPVLIFSGFLIYYLLTPPLPPIQPLPNPNGYDDLVKAGGMVVNGTNDENTMNIESLQKMVNNNSNALQLARSGLHEQCQVPLEYSQSYMSNHMNDLSVLKQLAIAFEDQGILASRQNRPGDAAKSYLDIFQLGDDAARGGVLIDQLVGTAIEAVATSYGIQKIADQLDAGSCRETAAALENLDAQRQTWNQVMQQENDWSRRTFKGLGNEIARLEMQKNLKTSFQKIERKFNTQVQNTRQLIINLAARAYELDKDKPLTNVADLVPDYLKAIPQDPFTGTNIVYSPR